MFFNSLSYFIFLIIAVSLYWLLPRRSGRSLILIASLIFYGFWKVEFLCLIIFSAFVDYYVSLRIFDASTPKRRKSWLIVSLAINIGLLIYFKYTYFITDNLTMIAKLFGQDWHIPVGTIILPLGISFYTFVSLSYTIDIYRNLLDPVRDFGLYLSYVMFWPHMIAGPILRGHELLTQLKRGNRFSSENLINGLKKIIVGLFFKVALADQLAPLVDSAFSVNPSNLGGLDVWTMAFGFGFQIYFDFAGYSLIAIGSALLLGIHFPENFDWPYLSTSPREFWKRWHITLSSWIRDYLYLPLSGARFRDRSDGGIDVQLDREQPHNVFLTTSSLFLSWFIMGLWHGASWNFALWGLWHATLIYIYRQIKKHSSLLSGTIYEIIGWMFTIPSIMLAWIPFRSQNLRQTFILIGCIFKPDSYRHISFRENFYLIVFLLMLGIILSYFLKRLQERSETVLILRWPAEVIMFSTMIYFIFIFLKPVSQFIYFQF